MDTTPALFEVDEAWVGGRRAGGDVDQGLVTVEGWFHGQANMTARFGSALRQSIDEVLDGQRTGRFDIDELEKTEKTYLGTRVEIVVRAEFGLGRGARMDYTIADHDVDAKYTISTNWTIPSEAMKHLCLLMTADDRRSTFRVGLLRISGDILNNGENKDGKRTLSAAGRNAIRWLVDGGALPENVLLNMPAADRETIFHASDDHRGPGNGGQLRVNELLRRVQGRIIDRTTAITVASQLDGPKRVRDARIHLCDEGIIVLGHQGRHPQMARELGLAIPSKGSWIAARLTASRPDSDPGRPSTTIGGRHFAIALPGEASEPVPAVY